MLQRPTSKAKHDNNPHSLGGIRGRNASVKIVLLPFSPPQEKAELGSTKSCSFKNSLPGTIHPAAGYSASVSATIYSTIPGSKVPCAGRRGMCNQVSIT